MRTVERCPDGSHSRHAMISGYGKLRAAVLQTPGYNLPYSLVAVMYVSIQLIPQKDIQRDVSAFCDVIDGGSTASTTAEFIQLLKDVYTLTLIIPLQQK